MIQMLRYLLAILALCVASLGQTLTTTDSSLNTGTAVSPTYTAPGTGGTTTQVHKASDATKNLWLLLSDPSSITTGSGTIAISYPGTGSISWTMSLTGLPGTPVDASPFVLYGCDQWFGTDNCTNAGGYAVDQPPQFPQLLSAMSSLVVDYAYALTGTITGTRDIDMIWDEWVCRTGVNLPNGPTDCVEVEVLPYYLFAAGHAGTFIRTYTPSVTLNGSVTTMSFDEYVWGGTVLYFPHTLPGLSSVTQLRFDMLPFLTQAVTDCNNTPGEGCNTSNFTFNTLAGMEAGSEFGDNTAQSYAFTLTKLAYEQTLGAAGATASSSQNGVKFSNGAILK